MNFEQHCSSKKHLRKAAAAAGALTGASVVASDSTDTERNTTYVGLQAQCRSYCKQVIQDTPSNGLCEEFFGIVWPEKELLPVVSHHVIMCREVSVQKELLLAI